MSQPKINKSALDTGPGPNQIVSTDSSGNVDVDGIVQAHNGLLKTIRLTGTTTNATPTQIYVDGVALSRWLVPTATSMSVTVHVVARRTETAAEGAAYLYHGLVRRDTTAATVLVNLTSLNAIEDQPSWAVAFTADTTNGAVTVQVTGEAAKTISWAVIATMTIVE